MASFGWSVGDIVEAINAVATIISALKDAGGASEHISKQFKILKC
jgi:hypothetical protein